MKRKCLEYIFGREIPPKEEGGLPQWETCRIFQFLLEPGEFSLMWASLLIRKEALIKAEAVFKDYKHPEPFNINGVKKIIEISSPVKILEKPLFKNIPHPPQSKETLEYIHRKEKLGDAIWEIPEEQAIQIITSLAWLCDIVKAKQPPIAESTSDISFEAEIIPSNIEVKDETLTPEYNKKQIEMMEKCREKLRDVLHDIPELRAEFIDTPIKKFGEKIFITTSKLISSLPDPDEEEREKFERLIELAKENSQNLEE